MKTLVLLWLAERWARVRARYWGAAEWFRKRAGVLATIGLGLAGWSLLTDVLARWLGVVVWEVSAGVLCLSLFGWKFAFVIARDGLYALHRAAKERKS